MPGSGKNSCIDRRAGHREVRTVFGQCGNTAIPAQHLRRVPEWGTEIDDGRSGSATTWQVTTYSARAASSCSSSCSLITGTPCLWAASSLALPVSSPATR